MEFLGWRDQIQSPVPEYVERFGPLPKGLLKLSSMLTVNTSDRLMADLTQSPARLETDHGLVELQKAIAVGIGARRVLSDAQRATLRVSVTPAKSAA